MVARALSLILTVGLLVLAPASAHAVDPVAGAQTAGDTQFPNVGNGGYDVSDYDIDIVWTPAPLLGEQSIVATTTITASTTGAPLSSFSLDFEGLTVDAVTVDGVTAATFSREEIPADTKYKLVVTPVTPVDGVFTTVVTYHGTPSSHTDADGSKEGWNATWDGATFVNQPVGSMTGFPNNNTPADKATYTFTLSVPTSIALGASAAVANGVLASKTPLAGSRTEWVWEVAKPMASELSLISIGRYDMFTSDIVLAGGLGVVKEWSFVDPTTSAAGSFAATRAKIKPNLDFLSARYGTYPANAAGLVVDNVSGLGINYALETQDRPFFPGSIDDATLTHELMHQWFGDNVSPEFWSDLWLNEGPATYAEAQYVSEGTTEATFFEQWQDTPAGSATWTTPAANPTDDDSEDLFEAHVYARGAMALEALRTAVGPTSFLAIMREWQVRYAGTSQGTEDFIALAEEVSGQELTAFFQDWIYDADKPAWPARSTQGPVSPAPTPVVSGTPRVGKKLTAAAGSWSPGAVLSYQWKANGAPIAGATASSYALVASRLGQRISVTVTGARSGFTTVSRTSAQTSPVAKGTLAAGPVPTIKGQAKVGTKLRVRPGSYPAGVTLAYQWFVGAKPVTGATKASFRVRRADRGERVSVQVTSSRPGYQPRRIRSARTAVVV